MDTPKNCNCCGSGRMEDRTCGYLAAIGDDQKIVIPDIPMSVCDACGEQVLPLSSLRLIDNFIAKYTERLGPDELREIRSIFGVDQAAMSEALGLGEKTYHRWEKGTRYPSRSMGYYLRVLREFPEAFEWLSNRSWHSQESDIQQISIPVGGAEILREIEKRNWWTTSQTDAAQGVKGVLLSKSAEGGGKEKRRERLLNSKVNWEKIHPNRCKSVGQVSPVWSV